MNFSFLVQFILCSSSHLWTSVFFFLILESVTCFPIGLSFHSVAMIQLSRYKQPEKRNHFNSKFLVTIYRNRGVTVSKTKKTWLHHVHTQEKSYMNAFTLTDMLKWMGQHPRNSVPQLGRSSHTNYFFKILPHTHFQSQYDVDNATMRQSSQRTLLCVILTNFTIRLPKHFHVSYLWYWKICLSKSTYSWPFAATHKFQLKKCSLMIHIFKNPF